MNFQTQAEAAHHFFPRGVITDESLQAFGEWEIAQRDDCVSPLVEYLTTDFDYAPVVEYLADSEWAQYVDAAAPHHLRPFRIGDPDVDVVRNPITGIDEVDGDWRTYEQLAAADEAFRTQKPAELVEGTNLAFRSLADIRDAKPVTFVIDGFLQEQAITLIAGPSEAMKTWTALHIARALLDGEGAFLFDFFHVKARAKRVLYLTPESSDSTLKSRLTIMRMLERDDRRLLISTVNAESPIADLEDPRLLQYINGADVILDTIVRFHDGDENSSKDVSAFNAAMLNLLRCGARTVIGVHHASKGGDNVKELTKDNMLRGSGDYAAVASTVWAQVMSDRNRGEVYVKCVKHRDFENAPKPFVLEGRPHLSQTGSFKMLHHPGSAPEYRTVKQAQNGARGGRPAKVVDDDTGAEVLRLHRAGISRRDIEQETGVDRRRVAAIIRTAEANKQRAIEGEPGPVFAKN
jgi:hypothetical protein